MADENQNLGAAPEAAAPTPAPAPAATPAAPAAAPATDKPLSERDRQKNINEVFLSLDGGAGDATPKVVKAKGSKNVTSGIVHVVATFNNTMVTVTDRNGNAIGWSSSGKMGFKGSRKGTAYAGQVVSQDACRQAMGHGLKEVEVRLKGPGSGRESAVRAVQGLGIEILAIKDVTPVPHNGCRPPKARRV
jgi:small subunit ribosomal protein S11